jgi:hypothetical protein
MSKIGSVNQLAFGKRLEADPRRGDGISYELS